MKRDDYFNEMRKTNVLTNKVILNSIAFLKNKNKNFYDFLVNIPAFKKRVEKKEKLRPFLLRISYELAGGKNWKSIVNACAAVEIFNISTYIDNTVFDAKHQFKEEDLANYILCSRILQCIAFDLLRDLNPKSTKTTKILNEICKEMYTIEYEDLNEFKELVGNYHEYMKKYLRRCYGISGVFFENIMKMGVFLAHGSKKKIYLSGEIGKRFGIVIQIINDLGDFVLPKGKKYDVEKVYQDQFSDLRNKKITLPIYYVLKFGSRKNKKVIYNALGVSTTKRKVLNNISRILLEEGAFNVANNLAKEYGNDGVSLLNGFKKSDSRNFAKLMFQVSNTNKYLKGLSSISGDFKYIKKEITLVDKNDKTIGKGEKIDVHLKGLLHRAFSICVFNKKGEILIQRRALDKYHCRGVWTNTCCSHQMLNESVINSASRRLKEEMGFSCNLKKIGKFHYKKKFDNGLIENEIDYVFVGQYDRKVLPNEEEICEYKWINLKELKKDIKKNPEKYSFWFKKILKRFKFGAVKND